MTKRFYSGIRTEGGSKYSAAQLFMHALKNNGGKVKYLSPEEQYKATFDKKMEAMKAEMKNALKYQFVPPGAKPVEKKISPTVEQFMKKIADKKAKEAAKKAANKVRVEPKYYTGIQGGRIDSKGNIYNAKNKKILKVDLKTGKIVDDNGICVGKYKPGSTFTDFKICGLIAKSNREAKKAQGLLWMSMDGKGGIWGANWGSQTPTSNTSPGLNGGWGGGVSGFWGGGDDKNGGGWW